MTVSGRVCQIETKDTYYGQQTILSLDSAAFCRRDEFSQTSKNFIQPVGMKPFAADGILCYLRTGEESPLIGENICVMGEAEPFLQKRNPGGFDAALYYRTKGIAWMVRDAKVIKRGEHYSGMKTLLLMLMYDREAPTKQAKTAALSLFRAKGFGRNAHSRMLY